jgi:hypothetical protein
VKTLYGELLKYTRLLGCCQNSFVPCYDPSTLKLTSKVKEQKSQNDHAISFGSTEITSEMWEVPLNRFERNYQMKIMKMMGLESEFEKFYIQKE